MKIFFAILVFLCFLGCSASPFKQVESQSKVSWSQNKTVKIYEDSLTKVFEKFKEAMREEEEAIIYERIEEDSAWIEGKKIKIVIKQLKFSRAEVTVKANLPRNLETAENILNRANAKINSIEYNNEGKAIN